MAHHLFPERISGGGQGVLLNRRQPLHREGFGHESKCFRAERRIIQNAQESTFDPIFMPYGETGNNADDSVELTWDGGLMKLDVPPGDAETGQVVRLLQGSRLITDWESGDATVLAFN